MIPLRYADDDNPEIPHRNRFLANRPLVAARFQAVLDMVDDGCSVIELAWAFNVTEGGVGQLLERARSWRDWSYGKGDTRVHVVPHYLKGDRTGRGVPSAQTRAARERLVS